MALKVKAAKAAEIAISSIGLGYDIAEDLRLKYCKGRRDNANSRLIEIDGDSMRTVVLSDGITISGVPKSIKCDKGERTRFRSDVISFQQMSEQLNQELSLSGKIPSGLFNSMFEFSGCWQKDAANTKSLAFDGVFITLFIVALEKSHILLCDHVKRAVPSSWDPSALARFIEMFGTHIIVSIKMGGKDVIFMKQNHSSTLQPANVQERLKAMADKRFVDESVQYDLGSSHVHQNDKMDTRHQRLKFVDSVTSNSYSMKEDLISICKRRGGSDNKGLFHHEWLNSVQMEPDVISMSFVPITSLLNGIPGSGFLSHAINLYLRYKPPIQELYHFLEFQLPRQWAPVFSDLPLGPQQKHSNAMALQFSFMGPKLYVNTSPVEVGKKPVTGLRLYLEGRKSNRLGVHLQHLSSLPKIFELDENQKCRFSQESRDHKYYERVQWKSFSHVCTAPVEADEDNVIVTGARLVVGSHGLKRVVFLRLHFSAVVGAVVVKHPEWDGSPGLVPKSGLISTLISHHFTAAQKPPPPRPADVNINSAIYPGGPPVPSRVPKLLRFVDTTEMTRGPQDSPGYWVVTGARLVVENGKISLRVKYSLLTVVFPDPDEEAAAMDSGREY